MSVALSAANTSHRLTTMQIFFSAGEPSGDLHGSNLIRQLQSLHPGLKCGGLGGPKMAEAGCELLADMTELAVMGLWPVLRKLPRFFALRGEVREHLRRQRPDAVVLIDYPGFNWHVARAAHELGVPVFYFGIPQIWAWASWRVNKLRRWVDHSLCKLPFEETWLAQHQCRAVFIGHPYYDQLAQQQLDQKFLAELAADEEASGATGAANQSPSARPLVAILPGSRTQEIVHNLPAFLVAAEQVAREWPFARFAIGAYNEKQARFAREMVAKGSAEIPVYVGRTQELMHAAHCCMACSGSVSLELLWHARPTVIHYHVNPVTYLAQKICRRVKYITLVNLLADEDLFPRRIVPYDRHAPHADQVPMPEYLTCRNRADDVAFHILQWLRDPSAHAAATARLLQLRRQFAQPGASRRAAEYIMTQLAGATPALRKAS